MCNLGVSTCNLNAFIFAFKLALHNIFANSKIHSHHLKLNFSLLQMKLNNKNMTTNLERADGMGDKKVL